jgi:hypothetical protein
MNIRKIVRKGITMVNPDVEATITRSTGYTTGATGKRIPTFQTIEGVKIQNQGQNGEALKQAQNLNVQGVVNTVYISGEWQGMLRGDKTGGDIMYFPEKSGGTPKKWMIIQVAESWPDFTKVIVCLQT